MEGKITERSNLNLTNRVLNRQSLKGQFGQAVLVEKLLKLKKNKKKKQGIRFIQKLKKSHCLII